MNLYFAWKRAIAELEMTSRAVKAADMLKCAFEDAEAKGNLHEAYEFQMLYVEMLIYMVIICLPPHLFIHQAILTALV